MAVAVIRFFFKVPFTLSDEFRFLCNEIIFDNDGFFRVSYDTFTETGQLKYKSNKTIDNIIEALELVKQFELRKVSVTLDGVKNRNLEKILYNSYLIEYYIE